MARYGAPKSLGSIFNSEVYSFANVNSAMNNLSTNLSVTGIENVSQSINIISDGDTLTLQDSLIKQISDNLTITTEDGYNLSLNSNKGTAGDLLINENSYHSNVIIANGNLTLKNGYLNLGKNGTLVLNGADVNAVLVNNQFQLRVQADTLVNHNETLVNHSTGIQESTDLGVNNSTKIVQIESSYAPLDAPVFTTSLALPPLVLADNTNVSSSQIGYLSNLTGDVQFGLNTINTTIQTVQSQLVVDASNISVLQSSVSTINSQQVTQDSNISSLQASVSTINTQQATQDSNIATLQSSVSTINTQQGVQDNNISSLQSSVSTINTQQATQDSNISSLQTSVSTINTQQVTQDSNISSLQASVSTINTQHITQDNNISTLQSSVSTINSQQVTQDNNIASIQSALNTKSDIHSPEFTGIPKVQTASANTNSTRIASTSYVDTAISSLIGTSPNLLNTLQEINTAINNDPNFHTTIVNQISQKANINNPTLTGTVTLPSIIDNGTVTCSNGITVSSGTVSFPSKSISTGAINSDSISSGFVDFTSSG